MINESQRPCSARGPRLRRHARAGAALAAIAFVAGCGASGAPGAQTTTRQPAGSTAAATVDGAAVDAILAKLGVSGRDTAAIVDTLDRRGGDRQRDVLASVRYDVLFLKDGAREATLPIPPDRFYLSVAPYVERTHDCFHHSLTTCVGELAQKPLQVTIKDSAGSTLVDGPVTTFANGFVGFWLPRDIAGTITVSHDGRAATAPISTGRDAPTCLTTLKLT